MKFKIIFISFNVLIVFSFLLIFLMPVFMLGGDYAADFFKSSWYIAVIFIVILIFINTLYFANRRILGLLETENWAGLKELLEQKIFEQNKLRKMYIRMYVSTCLAVSSVSELKRLEDKLRAENPRMMKDWALQLGLPYLLKNDPSEMKKYFGEFLTADTGDAGWIKWNYCFSLLLLKETDEAVGMLKMLCAEKKDPVLRLCSMYMLSPFHGDDAVGSLLEEGRTELKSKYTKDRFERELEKQKDNVQMLFLTKIFNEAMDWLYKTEEL